MLKTIGNRIFILVLSLIIVSYSQTIEKKELSKETINQIQNSFVLDNQTKATINAVTNNKINDLALNRELLNKHNDIFSVKADVKGITDQSSTGRCWMFAGLNIMRPAAMKNLNISSFEFSQSYLFFWDKLEKANLFMEAMIELKDKDIDDRELQYLLNDPVADGGWWNFVAELIKKYGVVPKEVMQENANTKSSSSMNKVINNLLRHDAFELRKMASEGKSADLMRTYKFETLKNVYKLLVFHLGLPPAEFTWRYEDKEGKIQTLQTTPVDFYKKAVGFDLDDYVAIFDDPAQEYNKLYQIEYCRNMINEGDMVFVNLPADRLKEFAFKSLQNNEPVWFAADVGFQMGNKVGIMAEGLYDYESLYGIKDETTKAERILYKMTTPNHAMIFVAADVENNKPIKWKVENSWGTDGGNSGYWTMYDNWFNNYVFTTIINKKYLPKEVIDLLKAEPVLLKAWDPMRSFFIN